jgi:hypothetical protein
VTYFDNGAEGYVVTVLSAEVDAVPGLQGVGPVMFYFDQYGNPERIWSFVAQDRLAAFMLTRDAYRVECLRRAAGSFAYAIRWGRGRVA